MKTKAEVESEIKELERRFDIAEIDHDRYDMTLIEERISALEWVLEV